MEEKGKCKICGADLPPRKDKRQQVYCSEACRYKAQLERTKKWSKKKTRKGRLKNISQRENIIKVNEEAKEKRTTYGKHVASQYQLPRWSKELHTFEEADNGSI